MEIQKNLIGTVFKTGYNVFNEKGCVIVGLSQGNSYFKVDLINNLLNFCKNNFSFVNIMNADKPSIYTYLALGHSLEKSVKKANKNGKLLTNHCNKFISKSLSSKFNLFDWGVEIDSNKIYQDELKRLKVLFESNLKFKDDVCNTTKSVLENKILDVSKLDLGISIGVNYLLCELAFLSVSCDLFGIDKIAYIYHNRWEVFENFVNGVYDGKINKNVGFIIVR